MFNHGPHGWMRMAEARIDAHLNEAEEVRMSAIARRRPIAWLAARSGRALVRLGESLVSAGCRLSRLDMLKTESASRAMGRTQT